MKKFVKPAGVLLMILFVAACEFDYDDAGDHYGTLTIHNRRTAKTAVKIFVCREEYKEDDDDAIIDEVPLAPGQSRTWKNHPELRLNVGRRGRRLLRKILIDYPSYETQRKIIYLTEGHNVELFSFDSGLVVDSIYDASDDRRW
jgi:hypothetical protein